MKYMDKKIVVLTASPRKYGNSMKMAESFISTAKSFGNSVIRFDTANMTIGRCHACENCYCTGKPCAFDDDFNLIAEELEDCDSIIFVSPVYWYSFPTQIKALIDRFYSLYNGKAFFENKQCVLISCCEDSDMDTFTGMKFTFEKMVELMHGELLGELLVPKVCDVGDIDSTDGVERAAQLAQKLEDSFC